MSIVTALTGSAEYWSMCLVPKSSLPLFFTAALFLLLLCYKRGKLNPREVKWLSQSHTVSKR